MLYVVKESISIEKYPLSLWTTLWTLPVLMLFFLIISPSFDSIKFHTIFSIMDVLTIPSRFSHSLIIRPIFNISVTKKLLLGWSECIGLETIGTPIVILSMQEFQPQWIMKSDIEEWAKIFGYGNHSLTTKPTSLPFPQTL